MKFLRGSYRLWLDTPIETHRTCEEKASRALHTIGSRTSSFIATQTRMIEDPNEILLIPSLRDTVEIDVEHRLVLSRLRRSGGQSAIH